ncbi:hypothetical protein EI94DRAFT_1723724 [Lactarius quietus]|nr:hypothetical protein EI94DRAFT_1723724 [Lactarius quietus]
MTSSYNFRSLGRSTLAPDFTGVTAEREVWVASLAAADCTNVNMFKRRVWKAEISKKSSKAVG